MASQLHQAILACLLAITTLITTISCEEIVYVTTITTVDVATTVKAAFTAPSPASYTSLSQFKDTTLRVTNEYRSAHNATPLIWNETLTEYARNWAQACIWKHSGGPYGENLAFGYSNASAAVAAWGDEGSLYDFEKPTGFTEETGHFTQLVWKSTAEVGCAAINCGYTSNRKARRDADDEISTHLLARAADGSMRAQGWFVVCEYTPPGNVVGEHDRLFRLNVLPRKHSTKPKSASDDQSNGGRQSKEKWTMLCVRC